MPRLLPLTLLLAAPLLVACGSLYPTYTDAPVEHVEYVDGEEGYTTESASYDPGQDVESVEVFYDELSEHGVWEQDGEHGYVFAPSDADYVPYTDGYWVETEYGQTWVAEDEIGWAVAHYGHWVYRHRWLWIPGTVWGPAWVDWRIGGGYIGWAPIGYRGYTVPYYSWRFVPTNHFYARHLRGHYRRVHDVRAIYPHTRRVDRYIRGANGQRYVAGPAHSDVRVPPRRARLADLPPRPVGRFDSRGARSDARSPASYRASRARSERMSRAAPERRRYAPPANRAGDRRYAPDRTQPRRYAPPTRTQRRPEAASPRYRYQASEPSRAQPPTAPPRAQRPTAPSRAQRPTAPSRAQRPTAPSRTERSSPGPQTQRSTAPRSSPQASSPSRSGSRATSPSSGPSRSAPARSSGGRRGR